MNIIAVALVYHYNIIGVSAEKRARYVIVYTITFLFALRTQQNLLYEVKQLPLQN